MISNQSSGSKRRRVGAFLAVLAGVGLFAGCGGSDSGPTPEPGPSYKYTITHDFGSNDPERYIAFGDSITNNGKPESGDPYPVRLSSLLGKTVVNAGIAGELTKEGKARVDSVLSKNQAGYILILHGANDIIHLMSYDKAIKNMRYMINAARNANTIPIIATLIPMTGKRIGWSGRVTTLNDMVRDLALEEDVILVDLEDKFFPNPEEYQTSDGVHPNSEGTDVIAEAWYNTLTNILVVSSDGSATVPSGVAESAPEW